LNLQNEPQKSRNSVRKPSELAKTVVVRCSTSHRHWQCVGSRAVADEGNKTGGSGTFFSSLSSYAGGEGHCHLQQGKKHTNNS